MKRLRHIRRIFFISRVRCGGKSEAWDYPIITGSIQYVSFAFYLAFLANIFLIYIVFIVCFVILNKDWYTSFYSKQVILLKRTRRPRKLW